jgi:hypothetical protein
MESRSAFFRLRVTWKRKKKLRKDRKQKGLIIRSIAPPPLHVSSRIAPGTTVKWVNHDDIVFPVIASQIYMFVAPGSQSTKCSSEASQIGPSSPKTGPLSTPTSARKCGAICASGLLVGPLPLIQICSLI